MGKAEQQYIRHLELKIEDLEKELAQCKKALIDAVSASISENPNLPIVFSKDVKYPQPLYTAEALENVVKNTIEEHNRLSDFIRGYLFTLAMLCNTVDSLSYALGAPGSSEIRVKLAGSRELGIVGIGEEIGKLITAIRLQAPQYGIPDESIMFFVDYADLRLRGIEMMQKTNDNGHFLRCVAVESGSLLDTKLYQDIQNVRTPEETPAQWVGRKMYEVMGKESPKSRDYTCAINTIIQNIEAKREIDRIPIERAAIKYLTIDAQGISLPQPEIVGKARKAYHNYRRNMPKKLVSQIDLRH